MKTKAAAILIVASALFTAPAPARADEAAAAKFGFPKNFDPIGDALKAEGRKNWRKDAAKVRQGIPIDSSLEEHLKEHRAITAANIAKAQPRTTEIHDPGASVGGSRRGGDPISTRAQRSLAARQRALARIAARNAANRAALDAQMQAAILRSLP